VLFGLVGVATYFVMSSGVFAHIRRDLAFNGTHVFEPNTGLAFPVELESSADGDTARPQRIIGLYLKTYKLLEVNLHILVEAIYIDRTAGRRILHEYKDSGVPIFSRDRSSAFVKFVDFIVFNDNKDMTLTFFYHMMWEKSQSQLADGWFSTYHSYLLASPNMTTERYDSLHSSFNTWMESNGGLLSKNSEFAMEWKSNMGLFLHNKKVVQPQCADGDFRSAWGLGEFYENGVWDLDLFTTLWDLEWDGADGQQKME